MSAGGETFERVVASLRAWEPSPGTTGGARAVRARLDADLNADAGTPWERAVVERTRGSLVGDVVVDGAVGVVLLDAAHVPSVTARLGVLADHFEYLVVYWWATDPAGADARRTVERYHSANELGLSGLAYVSRPAPASATTEGRSLAGPVALAAGAGATALLCAATVAVGAGAVGPLASDALARGLLAATGALFLGTLGLGAAMTR
ncbi:hypothetical protein [Halosegnis marinus]|uniref:Uncharacterized protein n=1 Tax=Halosegnis marinus TaxID=3034023 RepID=A0ABD5ZLH0_9EURY|nr:hypothetical protein [Halosegnis sp. DT85]